MRVKVVLVLALLCLVATPTLARHARSPSISRTRVFRQDHAAIPLQRLIELGEEVGSEIGQNPGKETPLELNEILTTNTSSASSDNNTQSTHLVEKSVPDTHLPQPADERTASVEDVAPSTTSTAQTNSTTSEEDTGMLGLVKAFMGRAGEAMKFGDTNARNIAIHTSNVTKADEVLSSKKNSTINQNGTSESGLSMLDYTVTQIHHIQAEIEQQLDSSQMMIIGFIALVALIVGIQYQIAKHQSKEDNTACGSVSGLPDKFYLVEKWLDFRLTLEVFDGEEKDARRSLGKYQDRVSMTKSTHMVFKDANALTSAEMITPVSKMLTPWEYYEVKSCAHPETTWVIEKHLLNLEFDSGFGHANYKIKQTINGKKVTVARMIRDEKFLGSTKYKIVHPDNSKETFGTMKKGMDLLSGFFSTKDVWEVQLHSQVIPAHVVGFVAALDSMREKKS